MTKYKEYFQKMLKQNEEDFDAFRKLHDKYALDPDNFQAEYNQGGKKVQYLIRKYEDMLCSRSEGSGYGAYSGKLAEKFHEEVKKEFPMIDRLGLSTFSIKKIQPR